MIDAKAKLRGLSQRLQACPTLDICINPKLLAETWSAMRRLDPEHGDEVTPALLAALILFDDESFGSLLNDTELTQLAALARTALDRYQLKINPPNQPGKLLAASLKEVTASRPP